MFFFGGVTNDEFKKILSIEVAKETRTILETTYKGNEFTLIGLIS